MQESRQHAQTCLDRLSAAIAEIGRALLRDPQEHPLVYIAELNNVTRHIAEAQEHILGARVEAKRFLDYLQKSAGK